MGATAGAALDAACQPASAAQDGRGGGRADGPAASARSAAAQRTQAGQSWSRWAGAGVGPEPARQITMPGMMAAGCIRSRCGTHSASSASQRPSTGPCRVMAGSPAAAARPGARPNPGLWRPSPQRQAQAWPGTARRPACNTATRSAKRAAAFRSCSTAMVVRPRARVADRSRSRAWSWCAMPGAPAGSSSGPLVSYVGYCAQNALPALLRCCIRCCYSTPLFRFHILGPCAPSPGSGRSCGGTGGALHDAGGLAVGKELVQHLVQFFQAGQVDLHREAVLPL